MADRPFLTQDIGWESPLRNIMQEAGQFMAGMGGLGPQLAQMQQRAIQQQRMQEDFSTLASALRPEKMTAGQERLKALEQGKDTLPDRQGKTKVSPQSAEQSLLQAMGQMKTKQGLAQAFQMYNQAVQGKKTESDILDYYVRDEAGNWVGRQARVPKASYNKAQEKLIERYGQENVSFGSKPEMAEGAETPDPWETRTIKSGDQFITKAWNPDKQTWETKKAPRWKPETEGEPEPAMKLNQWYNEAMPYLESLYGERTAEGGFNVNPAKRKEYITAANILDQFAKRHTKYGPIEAVNKAMEQARKKVGEGGPKTGVGKTGERTTDPLISTRIVEKAIGPQSAVKQFINNTLGAVTPGQKFPETERSRNKVRAFNQTMRGLLTVSARGAKFDIENINKYLPNPDKFFTDPDAAKDILKNLNDTIGTTIRTKEDLLASKKLPSDEAGRLIEDINKLETALSYLPSKEELEQTRKSTSDMTVTDIMGMSREELKGINPDNLSDEQARAVETRIDQLTKKQGKKEGSSDIESKLQGMPPGKYRDKETGKIYRWDGKKAVEVK